MWRLTTLSLLWLPACMTIQAVNPRPNVVVSERARALTIDTAAIPDMQDLERIKIQEFRRSLENGFRNAVGEKFVTPDRPAAVRLVLEQAELDLANLGGVGRFLTIRFRARWIGPDGRRIAAVAGVAQPRNPTETGSRHLEDVIEVMFERIIAGLDRVMEQRRPDPRDAPARAPLARPTNI